MWLVRYAHVDDHVHPYRQTENVDWLGVTRVDSYGQVSEIRISEGVINPRILACLDLRM